MEDLGKIEKAKESLYGFPMRDEDKRVSNEGRTFDIKRLWSRQQEILRLDSLGYKGREIAKILNCHPVTVSNALNSTLGKEVKSSLRGERNEEYESLREDILDLTRQSLDVYRDILARDSNDPEVSIGAKKKTADTVVLELSGLRAPTRVENRSMHMNVSKEDIEEFKARGLKAARDSGQLVEEAEVVEDDA